MDAERLRELAAALLNAMDPADLLALLNSMRKFPWETDMEAQTDHSGPLTAAEPEPEDCATPRAAGSPRTPKPKKYQPQARRALTQIAKAMGNPKARPVGLKKARSLVANIYEGKVSQQ
jgi:hypothetical protein